VTTIDDDEFGVARLPRYRRPGLAGAALAPLRWLRGVLANLELSATETVFAALVFAIFVALPIRLLGATTPEFRGGVITVTLWLVGLAVVLGIGGKLAPAAWRYIRDRHQDRED
jgi:hypothetical protein